MIIGMHAYILVKEFISVANTTATDADENNTTIKVILKNVHHSKIL